MAGVRFVAAVAVVATLLAACGGDDGEEVRTDRPPVEPAPPGRPAEITGPVSMVTAGSVRIDEGTGTFDAAHARVDERTDVLRRRDGGYVDATLADVRVGDRVEVWVDGPVAESYPVQAHAEAIVLAA